MKITYKYRGDLPLNTENNKNQNQSVKNSERRGMLKGCGGCLISFILLIILLSACSMMFSNNDNSTSNQSSKTQLTQKDENKNEDKPEENQKQQQMRIYNQPKKYPQMKILKIINMKLMK